MVPEQHSKAGPTRRALEGIGARMEPLRGHVVGRVALTTVEDLNRIEIFDRSMTLAAQIFTSVFPILIMAGVIANQVMSIDLADMLALPPATQEMLDDVLNSADAGSFGLVGGFLVFLSATSLSRALGRTYAAIWRLPRPRSGVSSWWRWLAVVMTFALSLLVIRRLGKATEGLVAPALWGFLVVALGYGLVLLVVSYVLVRAAVPTRWLAPGAVLGGIALGVLSQVSGLWLPHALQTGEERFGSIGVAFTYLGYLYVAAFVLVLTTLVGAVLVRDDGALGRWLRGTAPVTGAVESGSPSGGS